MGSSVFVTNYLVQQPELFSKLKKLHPIDHPKIFSILRNLPSIFLLPTTSSQQNYLVSQRNICYKFTQSFILDLICHAHLLIERITQYWLFKNCKDVTLQDCVNPTYLGNLMQYIYKKEIFWIFLPFFEFVPSLSLILEASFHKNKPYDDCRTPYLNHILARRHPKSGPFIDLVVEDLAIHDF